MENRFFYVKDYTNPAPEKATKNLLYENERSNGVIWVIPPGEELPAHYHPDTDDVWIILQGKGEYFLGQGKTQTIEAGMVIPAEKNDIHGVKNTGDELLVFAAVSAPMPSVMIKE
ncbi:MAG: cupin domain-containing protein [Desulfitobacteriia bacterium]|jgi:quercetin dioxygenase-like cupin family protein